MDRLTRKQLKHDPFAEEIAETLGWFQRHKKQLYKWGGVGFALLVVIAGWLFYERGQRQVRQQLLAEALAIYSAPVGTETQTGGPSYKSEQEKIQAAREAFSTIEQRFPSSVEAQIARYYLGLLALRTNNPDEAERYLTEASRGKSEHFASVAKLVLAQLYTDQKKYDQAEQLLRELVEHPTALVSKEQATLHLARVLAHRNPEEARKLLEPLRTARPAISRAALSLLQELSQTATP